MSRLWWLAVMGAGVLLWQGYGCGQRYVGALREQIRAGEQRIVAREKVIAALAKQKARVDTVKAKAKIIYVGATDTYDSTKKALTEQPTDTAKVGEFIRASDALKKACSVVLLSCEKQVAARDAIIGQQRAQLLDLTAQLDLEKKNRPGFMSKLSLILGGFAAGAILVK